MWALMNWKLWVLAALLALGPIGYMKGRHDGTKAVRSEWAVAVAQANSEARQMEAKRQSKVDEAAKLASTRQTRLAADSARAGDALGRLRSAITARQLAEESTAAAVKRADTYGKLLAESGEALREMARSCDRIVSDRQMLLDGWPR